MGIERERSGLSENVLTWLLVGAGDIAQKRVAPAITSSTSRRLAGICSRSRQQASELSQRFGCEEVYTRLDEALAQSQAAAVYLATPVSVHCEQVVRVLASGRHVLVEKPLGVSAADAATAVNAASETSLRAGCAYYRRLSPRFRHAKAMLEANEFGQVVLIRMSYMSWFVPNSSEQKFWRVVRSSSGGGPLADMGSHMVDLLIGLFGMPRSVYARAKNLVHDYDVEDSAALLLELQCGTPVLITCGWCSKTWSHEFEIIGSKARLKWDPFDSGPVLKTVGSHTELLDFPPAANVHAPLIDDFESAVRLGHDSSTPLREALQTNVLLDAAYRSTQTGSEVVL